MTRGDGNGAQSSISRDLMCTPKSISWSDGAMELGVAVMNDG